METVLRELEFNQWVLRINLKDLGGFWIKNYLHTSPTLAFQPEERDKIENIVEKIDQSPHLKKLKRRVVGNKYPVLQIDVPIRQMGPRHYSLTQLKNHFVWAKLDEEENQNKDYKNKGQRLFDYLINVVMISRFISSNCSSYFFCNHFFFIETTKFEFRYI